MSFCFLSVFDSQLMNTAQEKGICLGLHEYHISRQYCWDNQESRGQPPSTHPFCSAKSNQLLNTHAWCHSTEASSPLTLQILKFKRSIVLKRTFDSWLFSQSPAAKIDEGIPKANIFYRNSNTSHLRLFPHRLDKKRSTLNLSVMTILKNFSVTKFLSS